MSGILKLESLTKGNTLKQGDKTPLKYRLFDADGEQLNIAGKSAKVRLVYPDFLTIGYEKDGLTVAQDDTVTFTIDNVIPSRIYHVEIIVDDQFIFPSRADESKFTVDKSSLGTETNIIEIVGKDVLIQEVKTQVDTELQPLVTSLESAQQAETQRASAESDRESAEEQREADHANRSAEFDGKADKIAIKNLVSNGDFSSPNHPEWASNTNITYNIENNEIVVTGKGSTISSASNQFSFDIIKPLNDTSVYYITALAKGQGKAYIGISYNASEVDVNDNFRRITYLGRKTTFASAEGRAVIGGSLGDEITFKEVMAINLTQTFGEGNEPTEGEMGEVIKVTGYIDGEYALNNKEMLILILSLIRRNKSAIVALGGA